MDEGNMRENNELWQIRQRLFICFVSLLLIIAGITCFFIFPDQGGNMLGSSILIAFSYFTTVRNLKWQLAEFVVFLSVLVITIYAYVFSERFSGWLFVPQCVYLFCQLGRVFVFEELKSAFRDYKRERGKKSGYS